MKDDEKLKRDIEEIKRLLDMLASNVVRIERVLAHSTYIPTRNRTIRYSHKTRELVFDDRYTIKFEKNKADLMSKLFYDKGKKAGLPKTDEIALSKIAKENERLNLKPNTNKAVYSALKRINDQVLDETRIELFILTINSIRFNEFAHRNIEIQVGKFPNLALCFNEPMKLRADQVVSISEAKKLLGDEALSMTDEEIQDLIDDFDVIAQYTIKMV